MSDVTEQSANPGALRSLFIWCGGLAVGLGLLAGVVWWLIAPLPGYQLDDSGQARMGERQLVQIFAMDAWYCAIGMVVGLVIGGMCALRHARRVGWLSAPTVAVSATISALLCWGVGALLGPSHFDHRLAAAHPGDTVPVDLTVTAWPAVVVWAFMAVLPVLIWSTAARDDEEPQPLFPRRKRDSVLDVGGQSAVDDEQHGHERGTGKHQAQHR